VGVYLLRRLLEALLTTFLASVLVFTMVAALPGDPAEVILGDRGTPQQLQALRAYLGVDQPIPVQYARWADRTLRGDLGYSLINEYPVASIIKRTLPVTLELSVWALLVVIVIAFPAGVYAATHQYSPVARALSVYHSIALSVPVFWLGVLLSWFFGVVVRWLPPSGFTPFSESPTGWARSLVLPAVTLGVGVGSVMARFVQAALEEQLERDYIRTAHAKGLRHGTVIWRHGIRNALISVITVLGMNAAFFISGAVLTEAVFAVPGIGSAIWRAILSRDYFVAQSIIMIGTMAFIVINLLTDLSYALLDPRIRYQ